MSKFFKGMFALLLLPLLILLTGCNSEDAFSELTVKLERIDIVALPITTRGKSELTLAKGNEQPFEVIGHYSDSSSRTLTDLSVSNWHLSEQEVGYFDNPRVLIGGKPGQTSITVTKDGITSNTVDVIVCADLEGVCIDIFDTGSGKLFTSSPSSGLFRQHWWQHSNKWYLF
ncbi:MAG: hypothetical protein ACTH4J_18835 [Vibrio toranzoniae]|uniref:hypothetical protein n=1 Tax=Vibrio toranzoniae TaxID=1194427 RepID=UPI003F9E313E